MARKLYILTSGEYSDYHIMDVLEGEDTPSLETLFREFRAIYFPGVNEMLDALPVKGYSLASHEIFGIVETGAKKLALEGLIDTPNLTHGERGFPEWLVRERGFTRVDNDDFSVDIRQ